MVGFWLVPLLKNPAFNHEKTLILLTFDENETSDVKTAFSVSFSQAVPNACMERTTRPFTLTIHP